MNNADAVTEYWGERCDDFDAECVVCRAWAHFDLTGEVLEIKDAMSRHEALRIAMSEMSYALAAIDEMPDDEKKHLRTPPEAIQEAMQVIDEMMRGL